MRAKEIVDKLSAIVPLHTAGFSDSVAVTSVTVSGSTATATTSTAHGLVEGQTVAVSGVEAPVQIDAGTFARVGSTATFETLQDHDLTLSQRDKANGGKTVTLAGATEAEFTGTFVLVAVLNRRKLSIAVADSGPTTISGSPLVVDANGGVFNGLVAATNLTPTTFDYPLATAYPLDGVATASAVVQISIRVLAVLDIEQYLRDVYTSKALDEDVLVVALGDVTQSKKRNEPTDAADSNVGNAPFHATLIQPFAVYVVQNVTDELTGWEARDKIEEEYVPAIFSAVLRAPFDTGFTSSEYRATFTGHGVFAFADDSGKNKAIYVHEVAFEQLANITGADAVAQDRTVAMRDVAYTITTSIGTGVLTAGVNLDEDAGP